MDTIRVDKHRHFILSWSTGVLFIHKIPGELTIGFPYHSSNASYTGQFNSRLGNAFSQDLLLQDAFNFEFFSLHHSIDVHGGLIPNDDHRNSTYSDAFYFGGGYSHCFSVGKVVMIKTGADLLFYAFSRGLGNIDNRNIHLYVLGYDSGPTFSTATTSGRITVTKNYATDRLAIDLTQEVLAFAPSIRLTSPINQKLYWAVQATWFIPLVDQGGLVLTQLDSEGHRNDMNNKGFGFIGLDRQGITATFNGRPVDHSPYSLGGWYLGVAVGVCFKTSHR